MIDGIVILKDQIAAGIVGRKAAEAVPAGSWEDVDRDLGWAERHLRRAAALFESGRCIAGDEREIDTSRMALMHRLLCGYNAFEAALLRVMLLLSEEPPSGEDWPFLLVRQLSRPRRGRPASLIDGDLLLAAYGLHGYRIVALRTCGDFDCDEVGRAVQDGKVLYGGIGPALARFRIAVDPD